MSFFRIYCAGLYHSGGHACDYDWGLESYYYLDKSPKNLGFALGHHQPIFLDSGAYTAFTKGVAIDVDVYCDFIEAHAGRFDPIAAIDVIGDAEASWKNYLHMRDRRGLTVVPCFHYGEPYEFLAELVDQSDYIALGGVAQIGSGPKLIEWLDYLWARYLTNVDGTPKVRVHGFAVTGLDCMFRYPWYSVDSTSWVMASRHGMVMVDLPNEDGTVLNTKLFISDRSPRAEDLNWHYTSMSEEVRTRFREYIEGLGYDPEELRVNYKQRDHFNAQFMARSCHRGIERFIPTSRGLF